MKEDYLWDKTGDDAQIEGLENALKAFRYTETAPPELTAKVFTPEKQKRRRFFQLGFSFAAFAAVIVVLSIVWFQVANNKIPAVENVAETNTPKTADKIADDIIKTPDAAPVVSIQSRQHSVKPNVVRIRQKTAPIVSANKAVLRETKVKEPAETLTAEEKYAYDQLMLALSITGSKLKIVKDKLNGIEEQNAVLDSTK